MSIRFAAARARPVSGVVAMPTGGRLPAPANDHVPPAGPPSYHERLLDLALRHFACHGLAAAARARDNARAAWRRGAAGECAQWLDICSTLDRRMGDAVNRQLLGQD